MTSIVDYHSDIQAEPAVRRRFEIQKNREVRLANQNPDELLYIEARDEFIKSNTDKFIILRYKYREYLAELLGTFLLVTFGCGSVAQGTLNPAAKGSSYLTINLGFAFGLMIGIFVAGPISGAHLNPAITIANCILRRFPLRKLPGYIFSQLIGAFFGACVVMLTSFAAINQLDGGVRSTVGPDATAGIFITTPPDYVNNGWGFFIELVSTALLLIGILAINDSRQNTPNWFAPVAIGSVLGAIGMCTGWLTGFALNPARDFGPRIFLSMVGYGSEPFTAHNYYFLIPIFGPIVGAMCGILVYGLLVTPHIMNIID